MSPIQLRRTSQLHILSGDQQISSRQTQREQGGMATQAHVKLLGTERAEQIDWVNDPNRFGVQLDTKLADLKEAGTVKQRPWADTYWPTYQDGINHRWQSSGDFKNDLSPAEKFDAAFNNWNPNDVKDLKPFNAEYGGFDQPFDKKYYEKLGPVAKYCSEFKGNKPTRDAAAAGKLNSDGSAKSGKKKDDFGGVETWFGLCHAWCPASIREKEPLHAVVHNGVRFEVSDIKALLIACYDRSNSIMIGGRNNDKEIETDRYGRAKTANGRDINPGTFHILLANLIGRDKTAFIEDRTGHYEVWNQPISGYKVVSKEKITAAEAAALVQEGSSTYKFNPDAKSFYKVSTQVDYISESSAGTQPNGHTDIHERTDYYEYILELNAKGEVIGGEWLGSSKTDHPDFLWHAQRDGGTPLAPGLDLDQVRVLLAKSREGGADGAEKIDISAQATLRARSTKRLEVITVKEDCRLELTITGNGDMDAYAKVGAKPTYNRDGTPKDCDLAMYEPGSSERKTMNVKAGDKLYVTMRSNKGTSTATLSIKQL
jgi:hypothetical protein